MLGDLDHMSFGVIPDDILIGIGYVTGVVTAIEGGGAELIAVATACQLPLQYQSAKALLEQEPQQVQQLPEQEELLQLLEQHNQLRNL